MYRPVNQKISILIGIALINTIFFYWVSNSRVPHLQPGYDYKMEAGKLFNESLKVIKVYHEKRENFTIDLEDEQIDLFWIACLDNKLQLIPDNFNLFDSTLRIINLSANDLQEIPATVFQ